MNRSETLRFYLDNEYGTPLLPVAVSVNNVVHLGKLRSGGEVLRFDLVLTREGLRHRVPVLLAVPVPGPGTKAPCFIGLNFCGNHQLLPHEGIEVGDDEAMVLPTGGPAPRSQAPRNARAQTWCIEDTVAAGFAVATACYFDFQQDRPDGTGVLQKFSPPAAEHPPGAVAAWAFGLSRIADAVLTMPSIDPRRLAVVGHSRLGKAALLAGASDERFSVVIPSQSGTGGAAPNTKAAADSETVRQITTGFPHWFTPAYRRHALSVSPDRPFPFEQTDLLRLVAPRGLLLCNAADDRWADPDGQYRLLQLASDAWPGHGGLPTAPGQPALGAVGSTVSHFYREGQHSMSAAEWDAYRGFARRHWAMS